MKPGGSICYLLSTAASIALVLSSFYSTSGHYGVNGVAAQTFARMIQLQKMAQPIGNSGYTYIHRHSRFDAPVIRTADMVENAAQGAYWIDFHDGFDDRAKVEALIAAHPDIKLRHEFWDAMNAITVDLANTAALKTILDEIPGIKMVEPVIIHERPQSAEPYQILTADDIRELVGSDGQGKPNAIHDYTGVTEIHKKRHLYGNGIKVGVIDSGVDFTHPSLGGCFGPGCKVAFGYDFVGDDGKSPDNDPSSSCDGHGTHVAGIIAANDTMFLGVVPQATLGAYRVFSCKGGTTNDLIILALLRAVKDGMQVINLSLGGPGGWRQDREAALASKIANGGTIIVAAMGNEGRMGPFQASSPGVGESLLTVASTENEFKASRYFTVRDALESNRGSPSTGQQQSPLGKRVILYMGDMTMDVVHNSLVQIAPGESPTVPNDACGPIATNLAGKIALVRRGGCTFLEKANNVQRAGGAGVIFMDNQPSNGFAADMGGSTLKARTITMHDGVYLLNEIARQKKEVEGIWLTDGKGIKKIRNENGGFLSDFTSMGPDAQLNIKPDIAAPGGGIWSTFPLKLGGYALESGTSMSTPYIVGCVAMYLAAKEDGARTASDIKRIFQNTGQPRLTQPKEAFPGMTSIIRQGAGLVDMKAVLDNQISVEPSYISLNDTVRFNQRQTFTITNKGSQAVVYQAKISPAAGVMPFDAAMMIAKTPALVKAEATATFSVEQINLAPGETKSVQATFKLPEAEGDRHILYSGFVEFVPEKKSSAYPTVRVPFMGMKGDYQQVKIIDLFFGLKLVDSHGRLIHGPHTRRNGLHEGDDDESDQDILSTWAKAMGKISDEIVNLPAPGIHDRDGSDGSNHGGSGDGSSTGGGFARPTNRDFMLLFRMIVASEIMVVDLVSSEGSDPYMVKSYGVIKNGVVKYIPRNDDLESNAYQVVRWHGELLNDKGVPYPMPRDTNETYRLRLSLLKPFGNIENDKDFESHLSVPFRLQ
ncbi:hypothetical protein BGZ73_003861 [Actinomortierella ambigua]|nr:hypothetical protein BGZ73_003861 [Actinomortierella ambigua]